MLQKLYDGEAYFEYDLLSIRFHNYGLSKLPDKDLMKFIRESKWLYNES